MVLDTGGAVLEPSALRTGIPTEAPRQGINVCKDAKEADSRG